MDSPNVNWDVLKKPQQRKEGEMSSAIELGSCGLHIVHGARQIGMTQSGWNCHKVLHGITVKSVQIRSFFCSVFSRIRTVRRDTPFLSVFSLNAGKYGPEKMPHLDTFHAVHM